MNSDFKTNIKSGSVWKRGVFMLLCVILYGVAEIILAVVAVFQFGSALIIGRPNDNLTRFGSSLGRYIFQIAQFVTFNTEKRPFPFNPWPQPQSPD